jgi:molybdopterin synthase catalytic subunit
MPPLVDIALRDRPVAYVPLPVDTPAEFDAGGECVFLGRTRLERHPEHGLLTRLSYETYAELAERTLRDLAGQAIDRWQCRAVRIHHAVGEVPPGEASVLVQVLCRRRAEAFEACRFLIDALKAAAPIWKREEWERGATWAKGAVVAPDGSA